MTDSYISELQQNDPSAVIELFELELVEGTHYATGNPDNVTTTYRWHSGSNTGGFGSIVFNGQTYTPMPIEAEGFDYKSGKNDGIARPTLKISNLLSTVSTILIEVNKITAGNDLLNAKVTKIRTLAMFLDSINFGNTSRDYVVTVGSDYSGNYFVIDGVNKPTLTLVKGQTYTFIQSDGSNAGHPFAFRQTDDSAYTSGVTVTGTAGSLGAKTTFVVPSNAPASLKYYCTVHGNDMGNNITIQNAFVNPTANPNAKSRNEVYKIDRKQTENQEFVEFELSAIWDLPGFKLPKRQVLPRQFPGVGSFHD